MLLTKDGGRFMTWQQEFIATVMADIKASLINADAPEDIVRDLTEQIGFSVACSIDGCSSFEADGVKLSSILCFLTNEGELVHAGGNSFTHEYVNGIAEELFDEKHS